MGLAPLIVAIQTGPVGTSPNSSFAGYFAIGLFAAVVALVVLVIVRSSSRHVPKS